VIPAWAVVAAYAIFSLWARTQLPDAPIASHFGAHMQPDAWMPRDRLLLSAAGVLVAIMAIVTVAPFIMPPKGALERSAKAYGAICFGLAAFIAVILGAVIGKDMGWPVAIGQVIAVAMGVLFLVLGNFATKVRPNNVYGVRTPWTLSNEAVWDKTHRFAGPAMMLGGLFILAAGFWRPAQTLPIILLGAIVPVLLSVAYSYWLWLQLPPEDRRRMRIGA
jgi:uncharacterized membrane protein